MAKKVLIYKEEVYDIVGCAMKVHSILGPGFHESVYQEALAYEFTRNDIPFEKEKLLEIKYDDIILNKKYIADFICYDKIIIETKALTEICPDHFSQVINYLKATGLKLGLIVNFGEKSLKTKRIAY
ncbi:MAG: GxxExxY protein [Bacteroidales bacterium]|nr:GxxExxY protein [Bacteroidales bacterium]